jgi:hypothetical protein
MPHRERTMWCAVTPTQRFNTGNASLGHVASDEANPRAISNNVELHVPMWDVANETRASATTYLVVDGVKTTTPDAAMSNVAYRRGATETTHKGVSGAILPLPCGVITQANDCVGRAESRVDIVETLLQRSPEPVEAATDQTELADHTVYDDLASLVEALANDETTPYEQELSFAPRHNSPQSDRMNANGAWHSQMGDPSDDTGKPDCWYEYNIVKSSPGRGRSANASGQTTYDGPEAERVAPSEQMSQSANIQGTTANPPEPPEKHTSGTIEIRRSVGANPKATGYREIGC